MKKVLDELKELGHEGFQYEGAEASFELLMQEALGQEAEVLQAPRLGVVDSKKTKVSRPAPRRP